MRGSTRGNWAIAASISAPSSAPSGSSRRSASRTEPSARAAACGIVGAGRVPRRRRDRRPTLRSPPASGGSSNSRRQRERMVGSTRPGRWATIRISARGGGSSIIFSSALAPCAVEVVGAVDDRDAPAAERRRQVEHRQRAAHVLDADFRVEALRLGVPFAPHQREIGMRQRRELARRGMVGGDGKIARPAHRRRVGSGWASTKRAKRQASVALPIPSRPPISQAWASRPSR